jgi:hypothetical protein
MVVQVKIIALYIKTAINANLRQDLIPDGLEAITVGVKDSKLARVD